MLLMCQNTTIRVYGAWVKIYYVLCPKTYIAASAKYHNPPLVRDKPLGMPASVKLVYKRLFGNTTRVTRVSSHNANIIAKHQEPAEVLSQLGNTSNHPVYGEYKCC